MPNVKVAFEQTLGGRQRAGGMAQMLRILGLPLRGHHHSGIDDATNIAAIVAELLRRGWRHRLPPPPAAVAVVPKNAAEKKPKALPVTVPAELRNALLACVTDELVLEVFKSCGQGCKRTQVISKSIELAMQAFLQADPANRTAYGNASAAVCKQLRTDLANRVGAKLSSGLVGQQL